VCKECRRLEVKASKEFRRNPLGIDMKLNIDGRNACAVVVCDVVKKASQVIVEKIFPNDVETQSIVLDRMDKIRVEYLKKDCKNFARNRLVFAGALFYIALKTLEGKLKIKSTYTLIRSKLGFNGKSVRDNVNRIYAITKNEIRSIEIAAHEAEWRSRSNVGN
jgi:hypothetical protein